MRPNSHKTNDIGISNRPKTPFCHRLLGSRSFGFHSSFLIAKRKIRNFANLHLFTALHFSNRENPRCCHCRVAATQGSLAPASNSLIYTPKIRNRRNRRRISHLHFSNLYKSRPFSLYRLGGSIPLPASLARILASEPIRGYASAARGARSAAKLKRRP